MKLINRENYLNKIINVIGTPDIKIITGIRRSGKSKLLEAFKKYLEQNIKSLNIIHINFNLVKYENINEYHKLIDYINELYEPKKNNFLLIDEVQMCQGFEKAINNFHAEEKYDIYITGSNAFLSSSDLATLFTGRTYLIEIYPFSFKEYLKYYKYKDLESSFDKYVKEGGMAGSYIYNTDTEKYDYLNEIFNTLIIRDIKQKYKIRNSNVITSLSNYLMDNISNLTSSNNITKTLNTNNISITNKTIDNYIEYLCNAFLFYKTDRYDLKGKKYLSTQNKYYLADHSFRYAILGTNNLNFGHIYENIVAIELKRRGYQVYIGTLYQKEIDFVAKKKDENIYIQVSDNISDNKTLEREVTPLLAIKNAYPKIIIARTRHDEYQYMGIKIFNIVTWLLQD